MQLWLDDIRDPKDHGKPDAIWVKTAEEAMAILRKGEVSFISFDHDLGTELDGHDVASEIERLVFEDKIPMPQWAVHSANPVGEAEITAAMKSAERFSNSSQNVTRNNIHVGLEIGTSKICVCVSEGISDGTLKILGIAVAPSLGVRKGQIVDPIAAAECIRMAIQDAEDNIGIEIKKVSLAFTGSNIFSTSFRRSRIQRTLDCLESLQLEVVNLVPSCMACSTALFSPQEKSPRVLAIDLGGGTTDYSLTFADAFQFSGVIMVGGDHITNDISIGLRLPIAKAECLKIQEGSAKLSVQPVRETIILKQDHGLPDYEIDRVSLDAIIHLRVQEHFEQIRDEIASHGANGTWDNHIGNDCKVLLTGGGSKLMGIASVAEEVFKLPVELGYARNVIGTNRIIMNPDFTTDIGITIWAMKCTPGTYESLDLIKKPVSKPEPKREFRSNEEYLSALRNERDPGKNLSPDGSGDLDVPTFLRKGTHGIEIKHAKKL